MGNDEPKRSLASVGFVVPNPWSLQFLDAAIGHTAVFALCVRHKEVRVTECFLAAAKATKICQPPRYP
jgi:hypothetical protein